MANRLISGGYSAFVLGAKGWGTHLSRNAMRGSKPAPPAQEILKPTLAVLFPAVPRMVPKTRIGRPGRCSATPLVRLKNSRGQQCSQLIPIDPLFDNFSILKLENHNGIPRNGFPLDVVSPHPGPQHSASCCPVCDSHNHSVSRFENVMHLSRQGGIGRFYPLHHTVNLGNSLNVARPEVKFTIGLKHVVDKLDFSPIEHITKVAEHELLLGRLYTSRSGLSRRANCQANNHEGQYKLSLKHGRNHATHTIKKSNCRRPEPTRPSQKIPQVQIERPIDSHNWTGVKFRRGNAHVFCRDKLRDEFANQYGS